MKEAVGNTFVFYWVLLFMFLIMLLVMGSLMYSRAFKNRNEIITIIEKHRGFNNAARVEIDQFLQSVGYRQVHHFRNRDISSDCQVRPGESARWESVQTNSQYMYCIYRNRLSDYYRVEIFMYLDLPIVGEFISFPVRGETRTFVNWSGN